MRIVLSLGLVTLLFAFTACGGDEGEDGGSGGSGTGGTISLAGGAGNSGAGGTSSPSGGSSSGAAGTTNSSGGSGTQPLGAICAQDAQCSQSSGQAVCCVAEGCDSACTCMLENDCPGGASYLPCESAADCEPYGGGKVCCVAGSMQYCTKPSGCAGDTLP